MAEGLMLITSVICTRRPERLPAAIAMWRAQTYPNKELIIVQDQDCPVGTQPKDVRLITAPSKCGLGKKTNLGCIVASGDIIQKWDDDDIYAPGFLTRGALEFGKVDVALWYRFQVAFTDETRELSAFYLGGNFLFRKSVWEKCPFREVPAAIDPYFLQDIRESGFNLGHVTDALELYTYVRHGQNTWKTMKDGTSVDSFLRARSRSKR